AADSPACPAPITTTSTLRRSSAMSGPTPAAGRCSASRPTSRRCGDLPGGGSGGVQGLVEIGPQVLEVLEPHAEPHGAGAHTARLPLGGAEVAVGRARGMADQRARVADVHRDAPQ